MESRSVVTFDKSWQAEPFFEMHWGALAQEPGLCNRCELRDRPHRSLGGKVAYSKLPTGGGQSQNLHRIIINNCEAPRS